MAALAPTPALGRLLLLNGAAIVAVFFFLAWSPAPVTFPTGPWEGALLAKGAAVLLVANVVVVRGRIRRPHGATADAPSDALVRMRRYEHYEVLDESGVIGLVDETLGDRTGVPVAMVVVCGGFRARRFVVPLRDILAIDDRLRQVSVADR
jgi:hypothetical protein